MTKTDLIKRIADRAGLPMTQVEKVVGAMLSNMQSVLAAGGEVTFQGFGTFKVSERQARNVRNPRTGESLVITARKSVRFSPGKALKEALNQ